MWNRFGVTFQLTPPSAAALAELRAADEPMDAAMLEQVAVAERPRLLGIAYRMTGSYATPRTSCKKRCCASTAPHLTDIDSPAAYLTTITTRLAIDHLRSARVRRETYVGPWLPEPIAADPAPDAASKAVLDDTISIAFLVLLETLKPRRASRARAPRRVRLLPRRDRRHARTLGSFVLAAPSEAPTESPGSWRSP